MVIALVTAVVLLYTLQSFFTKLYTNGYSYDKELATPVFTVVSGLIIAAVTFFVFGRCDFDFNPWCILLGCANALALYGYNYYIVKCVRTGPYSILIMFSKAGSILMPIGMSLIAGWDRWDNAFDILINSVCIAVIIIAVYFTSVKPKTDDESPNNGKITLGFILSSIGLAICNGAYAILVNSQQKIEAAGGESNSDEMIIVTYIAASILSFLVIVSKKKGVVKAFAMKKSTAIYAISVGLVTGLAINFLAMTLPLISPTIFYTLYNSLTLVFSVLLGYFVFKEKLTKVNIMGVAMMCIALALMNILPGLI